MKPKFKPIQHTLITAADEVNAMQDKISEIIEKASLHYKEQKEKAIQERLAKHGYIFDGQQEYINFVKTRCEVRRWKDTGFDMLYVDGIPLFGWKDEFISDMNSLGYKIYFTE